MRKTESKKPKSKRANDGAGVFLEKGVDRLTEELVGIGEEIERISTESSPLEDIEGVKVLAAEGLEKYSAVLNRLGQRDRRGLEQSIGPLVKRIRSGLTLLKEAPE